VALVARAPLASADALAALAERFVSLTRPPMATVLVTGRADIASATGASGVILRRRDLAPSDARRVLGPTHAAIVLQSVHSAAEAAMAADQGVDGLVVGSIWPTTTHAGAVAGLVLLEAVVALGVPVFAIGGVTAARAAEARQAGAWGVAAITAAWDAPDCYRAAQALLAPWEKD
jgi:thiamine-phosphate pyrophosphorylase